MLKCKKKEEIFCGRKTREDSLGQGDRSRYSETGYMRRY